MATMKKPAPGGNRETGLGDAFDTTNNTPLRSHLKTLIVSLALWGLIPAAFATLLIQRGGMSHE